MRVRDTVIAVCWIIINFTTATSWVTCDVTFSLWLLFTVLTRPAILAVTFTRVIAHIWSSVLNIFCDLVIVIEIQAAKLACASAYIIAYYFFSTISDRPLASARAKLHTARNCKTSFTPASSIRRIFYCVCCTTCNTVTIITAVGIHLGSFVT